MKTKLRNIIENNTTKKGKIFDSFIQILILISLISFSIESLPDNSKLTNTILSIVEIICITIFSFEYLLRIYVAKHPFKYIFSFYGIIDLLAILPFFVYSAIDLRPIRTFRIFRIFRALKLVRYNRALHRYKIAIKIVKEEMVLFLIIAGILIYLSAIGIYFFENAAQPKVFESVFHSLWWAIITITTVGYGDAYPITVGGKIFTFFVAIIGVGIVTIPAGLVASALSKARSIEDSVKKKKKDDN